MKRLLSFLLSSLSLFGAAQFSGNAWTTTAVTDGTKQTLINNIETALLNGTAGWTTVSGHGTTNLLMLSGTTPQGLQIRARFKDNSGTHIQVYMENADSTLAPASYTTSNGGTLQITTGLTYTVVASKYQFLIYTTNPTTSRQFIWVGMPFLNTQLAMNITAAGWLFSNSNSDSDTSNTGNLRACLTVSGNRQAAGNCGETQTPNYEVLLNSNWWESAAVNFLGTTDVIGAPRLILNGLSSDLQQTLSSATGYRWRTASPAIVTGDVFVAWGLTGSSSEALINGQVWDCVYINSSQPINTTSTFNSHNWINLTNSNAGAGGGTPTVPGGLWFATN